MLICIPLMLLAMLLFPLGAEANEAVTLLASFEDPQEMTGWSTRDNASAEIVAGLTTEGDHYVRFEYAPCRDGWPTLMASASAIQVRDWSVYDAMVVDVFNAGQESSVLILRLDDMNKRYNISVVLPPQEWTRWQIPVSKIDLNTTAILGAYFHFDRPAVGGVIYLDNWCLVKGDVPPLRPSVAVEPEESQVARPVEPGYSVAVTDTMTKVRIDVPYTQSSGTQVAVSAAADEAEGFQILLMPVGMDLEDVVMQASSLTQTNGEGRIPAEAISFNQVGYVKTQWPQYSVDRVGWWPDPLLNPERFAVKDGDVQPIWVTVHVPGDTSPGIYTGSVGVHPGNAPPSCVDITLRVWDFALPREGSLALAFTFFEDISQRIHGVREWKTKKLKRQYHDLILSYRLAPDNIYRSSPPSAEDVSYWNAHGLTAFNIASVGSKASYGQMEIDQKLNMIDKALRECSEAGLDEKAYVYGFDEISPEAYPGLIEMFGAVSERFPNLKRLAAMRIAAPVYGYVDAWANTIETYQPALANARRQAGEEVWLYLSISGRHPYPNWFIEYPAIEARLVWWLAYLYDVDGFLYYAINHYNYRGGVLPQPIDVNAGAYTDWDPASFVTPQGGRFNGDGLLIYAGGDGPLASIRLANIRDGLEDYEYLCLLEKRLVASGKAASHLEATQQVKELIAPVVSGLTEYTRDSVKLRQVREEIAEMIESLG